MLAIRLRRANSESSPHHRIVKIKIRPFGSYFHLGDRSRIFDAFKITGGSQKIQSKLWDFYSNLGDLEESRTPIDGMKTRCTNRYTTRPVLFNYNKYFRKCKSNCILRGSLFCRMGRWGRF